MNHMISLVRQALALPYSYGHVAEALGMDHTRPVLKLNRPLNQFCCYSIPVQAVDLDGPDCSIQWDAVKRPE